MHTKVQNIKTKRPNNAAGRELARKVAEICGCTPRMVNYVWNEKRGTRTELGENITIATTILEEKIADAVAEVRNIINPQQQAA